MFLLKHSSFQELISLRVAGDTTNTTNSMKDDRRVFLSVDPVLCAGPHVLQTGLYVGSWHSSVSNRGYFRGPMHI